LISFGGAILAERVERNDAASSGFSQARSGALHVGDGSPWPGGDGMPRRASASSRTPSTGGRRCELVWAAATRGHCGSQKRPETMETGHYPLRPPQQRADCIRLGDGTL
jgi:hypothetical protein